MKTKKIILSLAILSLFFLFLGLNSQAVVAKEKFEAKFEKTVPLAKDGKVILKNISGDVEVKSWDKNEVGIVALKVSKASSLSKAKENAQKVEIEVNKEDNVLRISTKYPKTSFGSLNVSVNYHLTIPAKASMKVKSVSGDVSLEGIGGTVETDTVSGDIEVNKADKGVECKAISGDLTLEDISGDIYLNAVSGDMKLRGLKGSIEAEAVSGDIELWEVSEAQTVRAKTLSGEITYQGKLKADGKYYLKSHSGDVEMRIPADSAFDFEAKTFSGSIDSAFEITISGKISKKEIRGSVNGGGAEVSLSTFSGDISLKKK